MSDEDALPLPTGPPGPRLLRREVTIPPQATIPFVAADWADAIVTIERGDVDLCCTRGGRRRFTAGAILFLAGLSLKELRNPGVDDVVLVALSRRAVHPP